jgi:hypothetical protein
MGILGKTFKTLIHTATSPIDVAKDVVTLGGVLTDEDEPYTKKKLSKILEDIEELSDEVDDL